MNFGQTIEALKSGAKVAREGWNGKGMFVYHVPANSYPTQTEAAKETFGEMAQYNAYLAIKNINNTVSTWVPSINDCLAEDWHIVEAENEPAYETLDMTLTMDTLQKHADHCLKHDLPLSVLIDMLGFDEPELITNPPANIAKKMDYYRATYDENCNHKHAAGIRIIAVAM